MMLITYTCACHHEPVSEVSDEVTPVACILVGTGSIPTRLFVRRVVSEGGLAKEKFWHYTACQGDPAQADLINRRKTGTRFIFFLRISFMESGLVLSLVESHTMISSKIKGKVDNVAFVECVYCKAKLGKLLSSPKASQVDFRISPTCDDWPLIVLFADYCEYCEGGVPDDKVRYQLAPIFSRLSSENQLDLV
ncbi:hypothetical protein ACFE04_021560 [Oxalis oulophora]